MWHRSALREWSSVVQVAWDFAPPYVHTQRIRRQRELADQDRELQRKQREFTEDSNQRTFEERAKIAEKANLVLKQIAEQRKLDVIIQEAAYVSPKADITDDVIKALNSLK